MFRVWGKMMSENHLVRDYVACIDDSEGQMTRTKKVFAALDEICHAFDLSTPVWLDSNIRDFKLYAKTRFYKDSFVEAIPFDFLEFHVIEEDN